MALPETIPEDEASGTLADVYPDVRERFGFVPNHAKAFSLRPEVYQAWRRLLAAITEPLDDRRYELATVSAARRLRSSYCTLVHGELLADRFLPPEEVRGMVVEGEAAGLSPVDAAIVELAGRVVDDATSVTREDVDRLRTLGLSDGEIFDVVVAAAARCFFSKTLDALGAQADAVYSELDPELRDALTVGRPIADRDPGRGDARQCGQALARRPDAFSSRARLRGRRGGPCFSARDRAIDARSSRTGQRLSRPTTSNCLST